MTLIFYENHGWKCNHSDCTTNPCEQCKHIMDEIDQHEKEMSSTGGSVQKKRWLIWKG